MKKRTKAIIATGIIATAFATGAKILPEKTPEEISIAAQIEQLEIVLEEKRANGEGLTTTFQKINELKNQLQ